jgi:hypothetical protein
MYPMRIALLTAALILIGYASAPCEETPTPPPVSLLPGTDKPEIKQCRDGAAYVYVIYTIYVMQDSDLPGQDIYIYKPAYTPADPCGAGKGEKSFSITTREFGGANFFAGVSGNYLFIDQGTGPSYRTLTIFDMKEHTFPLLALRYTGARIEQGSLTYYETRDAVRGALDKLPCPEASKWKKQGLGVIYEEKMSFDLTTGTVTSLREYRCSPAQ